MLSWNTDFIDIEEVLPTLKEYTDELKGIASDLASPGRDISSFAKNADSALSLLP